MSEYGRSRKKKRSRKRKPWRLPVCIAFAVLIGAAFLWYTDRSGILPESPVQTAMETGSDSAGSEDEAVFSGNADESRPLTGGDSKEGRPPYDGSRLLLHLRPAVCCKGA